MKPPKDHKLQGVVLCCATLRQLQPCLIRHRTFSGHLPGEISRSQFNLHNLEPLGKLKAKFSELMCNLRHT